MSELAFLSERELLMCEKLIEVISSRLASRAQGVWTYSNLAKWTGSKVGDPVFMNCVNLLAMHPDFRVLEMHLLFFDPEDPESDGIPLDDEQTAHALAADGFLVNPRTGDRVQNYKSTIVPYFKPSKRLEDGAHG